MQTIILEKTTSTNDYVKKYVSGKENVAVFSYEQTGGKGTKGRSFSSKKGGVYLSVLKFYNDFPAENAYRIIADTAVAVVKTLAAFGISATIKWPNDIFVGGKKICGILTESCVENKNISYCVTGIGLNVNNPLPDDLQSIATTAKDVLGKPLRVETVLATLLYNLEKPQDFSLYKEYSCVIGKKIIVTAFGRQPFTATALSVTEDGRLLLDSGEVLTSAEIKLV